MVDFEGMQELAKQQLATEKGNKSRFRAISEKLRAKLPLGSRLNIGRELESTGQSAQTDQPPVPVATTPMAESRTTQAQPASARTPDNPLGITVAPYEEGKTPKAAAVTGAIDPGGGASGRLVDKPRNY